MNNFDAFREQVAMKYQLFNGLFIGLPFEGVRNVGITLPVFASRTRERLEEGQSPLDIVQSFLDDQGELGSEDEADELLFRFMQLVERQVVLFDALEDAAFEAVRDMDGPGSLKEILTKVENADRNEAYRDLLSEYRVRVVLTAHPTQFYPDEVLTIITDLATALEHNDLKRINDILLQMGKTRFKNKEKPSPLDEAKSLLWYMENVFFHALPGIQRRIVNNYFGERDACAMPAVVELGFWPGGDRDGNPFVTSDLTIRIGNLLRSSILRLYIGELSKLKRRLTFAGVIERIHSIDDRLRYTLYPYSRVDEEGPLELDRRVDVESLGYENPSEFLAELFEVRDMIERDHMGLFLDRLDDLIFKVQLFGFHFATMDIRQDSRVHAGVLDDLVDRLNSYALGSFEKTRYSELDFHGRIRVLKQIAELFPLKREIFDDMPEGLSRDTIRSLRAAQHIQMRNGERGVHRYIISNTQSLSNILEVWLLAHCAAWGSSEVELDIVPLFETVTDLNNAVGIMRDLYELPLYRRHLEHRGGRQTIMVGFSDGTKDGGYVTANWLIYRTKTALTKLSEEYGYRVTFFDGRGGPPARGGGNTHKFYRAHGSSISSKQIHLTVQGQTISSKYGTQAAARYNVEQLVSSGLENNLFPDETRELNESEIALIDEISAASNAAYVSLKKHPRFVSYLQHMTPLTFYGQTNIGSRPTSRGKGGEFRFEDLRAIPFVGAWSQMKQNIPGYYGLGSGLNSLLQAGRKGELLELYRNSLFFRTLIENAMQSLSKTYFPLTFYLERDPEFGDFWKTLYDEARLTVRAISEVSGQAELLQNDPVTRESIRMREEMVLPLLAIQQFALAKVRLLREEGASPEKVAVYEKMVVKSLAGSVNASRNAV